MSKGILQNIPFEGFESLDGKRHVYVCDMQRDLSRWSKSAVDYFDMPGEYMEHASDIWIEKIHPEDREKYLKDINLVFSGKKEQHELDYRAKNKYGEYVACTCLGRVIPKEDGEGTLFVGTIENHGISSMIDSVTGLYNVYAFLKDAADYRHSDDFAIILIFGINRFTDINKNYGYEFGDKLLKKFAEDIRSRFSDVCKLYRMDGTKFCFVMCGGTIEQMQELYGKLQNIAHTGYEIENNHISFTIAGGVVSVDEKTISEYSIQASLEYVIEQSKRYKHGELVIFSDSFLIDTRKNLSLLEEIRNCVFNHMEGFYLCYQPIIDVKQDKICGMEALLRWRKEPFGEVPPGVFIPWLENDPCFFQLGNWILKQALIDAKKILEHFPDFMINVNVSAEQIERSDFRKSVCDIMKEVDFPPQNLCMELTERVVSLDLKFLKEELDFFRGLGISIALDDFGTGVSSLNLLLELSVDHLKIDRNFVKDISTNKAEQLIVETITFCAEGMNLDICVEGVETEEMKQFLKRYKIRNHQGYLYSKPVVYDRFLELLEKDNSGH